jgi:hypothetical protein
MADYSHGASKSDPLDNLTDPMAYSMEGKCGFNGWYGLRRSRRDGEAGESQRLRDEARAVESADWLGWRTDDRMLLNAHDGMLEIWFPLAGRCFQSL